MAKMIEIWKQELSEKREKVLLVDKMKIWSTRGIVSANGRQTNDHNGNQEFDQGMSGSFRKLEID